MRSVRLSFHVVAAAAAFLSSYAAAGEAAQASRCAGELPPQLAVPGGNQLAFGLEAEGVQVYACAASGAGFAWALKSPDAQLFEPSGSAAGKHYAGPTWESLDGSTVVGAKLEAVSRDPSAIPWLLLRATTHAGTGRMGAVTFVQRIRTSGGNAPSAGCDAEHAGSLARVPYRALYCFYRGEPVRR
jgi:hypothetical protein